MFHVILGTAVFFITCFLHLSIIEGSRVHEMMEHFCQSQFPMKNFCLKSHHLLLSIPKQKSQKKGSSWFWVMQCVSTIKTSNTFILSSLTIFQLVGKFFQAKNPPPPKNKKESVPTLVPQTLQKCPWLLAKWWHPMKAISMLHWMWWLTSRVVIIPIWHLTQHTLKLNMASSPSKNGSFCSHVQEAKPHNAPELHHRGINLLLFIETDHGGDKLHCSRTGFFILLNLALIAWLLKNQPTIKTSVFGAEFVAMKHTLQGISYR